MANKTLKTRIINKHDVEANWDKAVNFIPKKGEIIVYDEDDTHSCPRFKVGDGKTVVSSLPFTTDVLGKTIFESDEYTGGTEFDLVKYRFKTGPNTYGAVLFGKEGSNSGAMIGLEQEEGTRRLNFRASSTAGAIVWNQPEANSQLFLDVTKVNFRTAGYLADATAFRPNVDGKKDLGASSYSFRNIYGDTIYENGTALPNKYVSKAGSLLDDEDLNELNSYADSGTYYGQGGNKVTNKPNGIDAFGLSIVRTASGYVTQTLYPANSATEIDVPYIRTYKAGTWTDWSQFITTKKLDLEYEVLGEI